MTVNTKGRNLALLEHPKRTQHVYVPKCGVLTTTVKHKEGLIIGYMQVRAEGLKSPLKEGRRELWRTKLWGCAVERRSVEDTDSKEGARYLGKDAAPEIKRWGESLREGVQTRQGKPCYCRQSSFLDVEGSKAQGKKGQSFPTKEAWLALSAFGLVSVAMCTLWWVLEPFTLLGARFLWYN